MTVKFFNRKETDKPWQWRGDLNTETLHEFVCSAIFLSRVIHLNVNSYICQANLKKVRH
jgi:hypothetical protein